MEHARARTVDEVIAVFGGAPALARWAGMHPNAVFNWKARGEIPPCWHFRLLAEARRRHIILDPQVFGLNREDADALGPVLNCPKRKAAKAAA
jgi:hypothetical protein